MSSLEGVKVLDFTRVHAGPFASMVLADLGATVVKVERPQGDETRAMTLVSYGEMSAFFIASNRNKRSVICDLHAPGDRGRVDELVRSADIVIDNFKPPTLRRLGLDYDSLKRVNPRVIGVSVCGWGSSGPDADNPAYDLLAQARSGVMSTNGEPGQRPLKVGVPIGDLVAGLYAAVGAIAALYERTATGKGQRVEVSMLDAQVAMLHYHYSYYDASGTVLPRIGSEHQNIVPYGMYACADGFLAIAVVPNPPKFWNNFCETLGRPSWIADARFATPAARLEYREELTRLIGQALLEDSRASWLARLREAGVPAAPVNGLDDLVADPELTAREMLVELSSPSYGMVRMPGNPIKMDGALPLREWTAPPLLGEAGDFDPAGLDWRSSRMEAADAFDASLIAFSSDHEDVWLRGWQCERCERLALGLRVSCPVCGNELGREVPLGGDATLETWTAVTTRERAYVIGYGLVSDQARAKSVRVFAPVEVDDEDELCVGQPMDVAFRCSAIGGVQQLHHCFVPHGRASTPEDER
jgi:formyl-CoA transferase